MCALYVFVSVCMQACMYMCKIVCMHVACVLCMFVSVYPGLCVRIYTCELCVCGVGVCGVCMHMHACTRVCACAHLGMLVNVCLCVACTSMCVHTCAYPQGDHRSLACMWECICASCQSIALLTPLRFLGCKGFPGACMMGLCTRCQRHPNMQLPLLLSNPRLPNTSLHPSETSTSPTSAYQVRN